MNTFQLSTSAFLLRFLRTFDSLSLLLLFLLSPTFTFVWLINLRETYEEMWPMRMLWEATSMPVLWAIRSLALKAQIIQ